MTAMPASSRFEPEALRAVYRAIFTRRDVRGQFLPDAIADGVLARLLAAAHHAPSVGFMQPWDFLLIRDRAVKRQVHGLFETANAEAAEMFAGEKAEKYRRMKLEGILDAPVNLCISCTRGRSGPVVLGRTHHPEMDLYSTVCAAQNLWLAARAEGIGVGWVSILDHGKLANVLGLPDGTVPVAYLCLGHVRDFLPEPELARSGWRQRLPLAGLVHAEAWGCRLAAGSPLLDAISQAADAACRQDMSGFLPRNTVNRDP